MCTGRDGGYSAPPETNIAERKSDTANVLRLIRHHRYKAFRMI
jgi:hypothetical protein